MPNQQGKSSGSSSKASLSGNTKGYAATKHTSPKAQANIAKSSKSSGKAYSAKSDRTLSASQAKSGGFRPEVTSRVVSRKPVKKGAFRFQSNPTKEGVSSGYHEAFVVTDAVDQLSRRTKSSGGFAKMPSSSSGYWKKHSNKKIIEKNVKAALEASDGARTDTARTIITGPGGKGAGHSGSGVSTTGQAHAHDLLRDQSMRSLTEPKMTPPAQAVIAANTTLWSMAPGVVASQTSGAAKLKSKRARATWEEDRNETKLRMHAAYDKLSKPEKQLVLDHEKSFVKDIGDKKRKRSMDRPGSPLRETGKTKSNPIHGGDYFAKPPKNKKPRVEPPKQGGPRETAQYITEPFRMPRRDIK